MRGAHLNPAVAVGLSAMRVFAWDTIWVYLLANFAGGVAAAFAFKALNADDK